MAWRQGGFKPEGGVRNVCPGVINRESFKRNLARSPRGPCELSKITGRRQPRPVFTERRGRGILRTSPLQSSRKFAVGRSHVAFAGRERRRSAAERGLFVQPS